MAKEGYILYLNRLLIVFYLLLNLEGIIDKVLYIVYRNRQNISQGNLEERQ
jgi:hypothetical protein